MNEVLGGGFAGRSWDCFAFGDVAAENERLGEQGLRVMATARKDFAVTEFDATADLLPLMDGLELLALVVTVDPPRTSFIRPARPFEARRVRSSATTAVKGFA